MLLDLFKDRLEMKDVVFSHWLFRTFGWTLYEVNEYVDQQTTFSLIRKNNCLQNQMELKQMSTNYLASLKLKELLKL